MIFPAPDSVVAGLLILAGICCFAPDLLRAGRAFLILGIAVFAWLNIWFFAGTQAAIFLEPLDSAQTGWVDIFLFNAAVSVVAWIGPALVLLMVFRAGTPLPYLLAAGGVWVLVVMLPFIANGTPFGEWDKTTLAMTGVTFFLVLLLGGFFRIRVFGRNL
jgi:hypothetical protein